MERHLDSSVTVATWLEQHPKVESVDFAGLPSNPAYGLAQTLYGGRTGSVFAVTVRGGAAGAASFLNGLRLVSHMTNIGDVRSMALHPATTTHSSFTEELRQRLGITQGLVRLSIGIEDVNDIIADLDRALASV
jgi:O-acetylhomoserine (thiol)-lyase